MSSVITLLVCNDGDRAMAALLVCQGQLYARLTIENAYSCTTRQPSLDALLVSYVPLASAWSPLRQTHAVRAKIKAWSRGEPALLGGLLPKQNEQLAALCRKVLTRHSLG